MAARALELLRDDAKRVKMGEAGRAFAIENYQIDRVIPMYAAYYERVMGR
jgi:glycosyltransferase involved in cell wall biosynthesis